MRVITFKARRVDNNQWIEGNYSYNFWYELNFENIKEKVETHHIREFQMAKKFPIKRETLRLKDAKGVFRKI